jgi:Domain of unknown function (DUF4863)
MAVDKISLVAALEPLLRKIAELAKDGIVHPASLAHALNAQYPLSSPWMKNLRRQVREGVEKKTVAVKSTDSVPPVRFERLRKPDDVHAWSIDIVHMSGPGLAHTHPAGEIDLCFAVGEGALFDGQKEGFVVYGMNSHHTPTVSKGSMDILYFLPDGKIDFSPAS